MDNAIWLTIAGMAGGLIGYLLKTLFKGPRELQGDAERRISTLENAYGQLSLKVEGTYSRHDEILENLTDALKRLTDRFDRFLERYGNGNGGR